MGAPRSHAGDTLGLDEGAPALSYRRPAGGDAGRAPKGQSAKGTSSKHVMRGTGPARATSTSGYDHWGVGLVPCPNVTRRHAP